jgi:hypothetical protein
MLVQEFGWTGTLQSVEQSDLLVYPDILEECRSEGSMEESVRTVSGSRVGVVYDRHAMWGIDKGSKDPCEM